MTQYFCLTFHGNKFYAQVQDIYDNTTEISVGGSTPRCVTIHVFHDEKYVYLLELLYDSFCNLDNNLVKKQGTIAMIHAAFALCKHLFPDKTSIHFTDESVIKCQNDNSLPLPEVYLMLYGKTWYQTHFDAKINKKYERKLQNLQNVLQAKPTMKWDLLWSRFLSMTFPTNVKDTIHQNFIHASSWHEFFLSIKDNRCKYWRDWVIPFFNTLFKGKRIRGTEWHMPFPNTSDVVIAPCRKMKTTIRPTYNGVRFFGGSTIKYMEHVSK